MTGKPGSKAPADPADARDRLACNFPEIDAVFPVCLERAEAVMSEAGIGLWLAGAARICRLYRGVEPVVAYLQGMPAVVRASDETVLAETAELAAWFADIPYGPAIRPFLDSLPAATARLNGAEGVRDWFHLVRRVTAEGRDGLVAMLEVAPQVLSVVGLAGMVKWVEFGLKAYRGQQHRLPDYFSLATPDAHAVLQRERHGTLLVDHHRQLTLTLKALWDLDLPLQPMSMAFDDLRRPAPFLDKRGMHLPDVLDDENGVAAIDRYRAAIAHMAAHHLWSRPFLADNYSQFQHLAIEAFEDARVETLAIRRWPGLRRLFLALHPMPRPDACPAGFSPIRHRMAMLSRALIDPSHPYDDPVLRDATARFQERLAADPHDHRIATELGVETLARLHHPDFHLAQVWFADTVASYRDDNRYLWQFLEDTDSADDFHSDHGTPDPPAEEEGGALLPVLYPEWDRHLGGYRPDWATVWPMSQPAGDPGLVDRLLEKNRAVADRVRRVIDRLKPQQRRRIRHQRDGEDLDLDLVIKAMIDLASGRQPDDRVYQSHIEDGRDIALLLLLDLSESLRKPPPGSDLPLLELAQEAAALLAWAVDALGDRFAIAGFSSETRHQVRIHLIKDFAEPWDAAAKARLGGVAAGANTRMGAALRHAGRLIAARPEERKLILLLSDGEPSDVDVDDPEHLKWDTHMAVGELRNKGISTFCITLDGRADAYVADIFGQAAYTVVDQVDRLPDRLTRVFLSLTG